MRFPTISIAASVALAPSSAELPNLRGYDPGIVEADADGRPSGRSDGIFQDAESTPDSLSNDDRASPGIRTSPCPYGRNADGTDESPCTADAVIVGGGVAGLAAAAYLKRRGHDVVVLEANDNPHAFGRVSKGTPFDWTFGIDYGAEWIHTQWNVHSCEQRGYASADEFVRLLLQGVGNADLKVDTYQDRGGDWRWKNSTWFDFFNNAIFQPNDLEDNIIRGVEVHSVQTSNDSTKVHAKGADSLVFEAPHAIVAIPMNKLQDSMHSLDGAIEFEPNLHFAAWMAIGSYDMGPALKGWVEVPESFTEDELPDPYFDDVDGCDMAFFFNELNGRTDAGGRHIAGYFTQYGGVGKYGNMSNAEIAEDLKDRVGSSLGVEPLRAVAKNWMRSRFVGTGYTEDGRDSSIRELQKPFHGGHLFFAGEAVPPRGRVDYVGLAHGAAESGKTAAKKIHCRLSPDDCEPPPVSPCP